VVKAWGDQAEKSDYYSSAKPILSTLLFFALKEGKVRSVDQPIAEFGWPLSAKDRAMTFRHLGAMSGGYARPEAPGAAWSYNDFAINLYQKTLFDRVFAGGGTPEAIAHDPGRFGALGLEDGLSFRKTNRRISGSARDLARLGWFWLNEGAWDGRQVLPREMFREYVKPQAPKDLPQTARADTDDYLKIGSYGGGSDHFSNYGPGIYGFNWWFNANGRTHPDAVTWPDAPADVYLTLGFGGNSSAILPSRRAVLVALKADWGAVEPGEPDARMNRVLKAFAEAVTPR
jgi:CubicO group peptidase (beta-lactamase class C family)